MKAMKPFYFVHPQYGKLRVVVIDGKIYYCLMDVKNIFKKSVQKLYETIADSEGELKNLNIVMMKDMKIKYNLFFENQEMGKEALCKPEKDFRKPSLHLDLGLPASRPAMNSW